MRRGREPIRHLHTETKRNAKRRGIEHSLTLTDVRLLFREANGRCQLTGTRFSWDLVRGSTPPFAPSLDRIDNDEGYHNGNVRLVCICVNSAMREWGDVVVYTFVAAMLSRLLENTDVSQEGPEGRPREMG
jgi:hypothetical protein